MQQSEKAVYSEREGKLWRPPKNQTSGQPSAIQNKTWSPNATDSLYIFKFSFSMYFNSSWTEMSFIDMMTNPLLAIWNLVWTKRQTGQATTKDFPFTLLYLGTTNVRIFPFLRPGFLPRFCLRHLSFRWIHNVSFHGLYIKKIRWFQRPKQRETAWCKLNMQMFVI